MEYILTVDVGATSIKVILFDRDARIVKSSTGEYSLLTERESWVELPARVYWETLKCCVAEILGAGDVRADEIRVMTVSTQGETFVTLDERGADIGNAIIWIDGRATSEAQLIRERFGRDAFFETTGLGEISPIWPACKILWIRRNEPRRFEKTRKILLLQDYLIFHLTGEFVCELTNASSCGYLNINTAEWWREMMEYIGVRPEHFGRLTTSGTIVGPICRQAADDLGLSEKTMVATGAQDQTASALGGGNIRPGILTETTGTALALIRTIDKPRYDLDANINYVPHSVQHRFIALAVSQTAGIVLKWFKDTFCGEEIRAARGGSVYAILDEMAKQIPPGCEGLTVSPHFNGKLFPGTDPNLRGAFRGVSFHHTKGHFVRAIMESVAFMLRENIEYLDTAYGPAESIISLGGGAKSRLWAQMKSDVLGAQVKILECSESPSLGSAMLAAVAIGWASNIVEACNRFVRVKDCVEPDPAHAGAYDAVYREFLRTSG
jgi:xylulokinase